MKTSDIVHEGSGDGFAERALKNAEATVRKLRAELEVATAQELAAKASLAALTDGDDGSTAARLLELQNKLAE